MFLRCTLPRVLEVRTAEPLGSHGLFGSIQAAPSFQARRHPERRRFLGCNRPEHLGHDYGRFPVSNHAPLDY